MLINDYINLHQIPEIGFKEFSTNAYILNRLKNSKAEIFQKKTGILAFFNFKKSKTIAFRCELDALKIEEKTNLPYASKNKGYMHACGHDAHMSILLALMDYVNKLDDFNYNILLVFQPSEEKIGGSIFINKYLVNYNIEYLFAIHVFPTLKKGIYTSNDVLFASSREIDLEFNAKCTHIGNYNKKNDSIYLAYSTTNKLTKIAQKNGMIFHYGILKSYGSRNVTSSKCIIKGSLRGFDYKKDNEVYNKYFLSNKFKTKTSKYIPPLINDSKTVQSLVKNLKINLIDKPFFQSEDFSFYNENIKKVYFLLGIEKNIPLHSDQLFVDFDDLNNGYNFYLSLLNHFNKHI